jgi:hypothetical protein
MVKTIEDLKDRHKGKRGWVVGMGPSLLIDDLTRIKDEVSVGVNKCHLAFDLTAWRPTYYTLHDIAVAEYMAAIVSTIPAIRIFPNNRRTYIHDETAIWVKHRDDVLFSENLSDGIVLGTSITIMAIQIAWWVGCDPIYLIGVEHLHNISKGLSETNIKSPYGYNYRVQKEDEDHYHFLPNYRKKGDMVCDSDHDNKIVHNFFNAAARTAKQNNRRIFNASRQTRVKAFPRVFFDTIVQEANI